MSLTKNLMIHQVKFLVGKPLKDLKVSVSPRVGSMDEVGVPYYPKLSFTAGSVF